MQASMALNELSWFIIKCVIENEAGYDIKRESARFGHLVSDSSVTVNLMITEI